MTNKFDDEHIHSIYPGDLKIEDVEDFMNSKYEIQLTDLLKCDRCDRIFDEETPSWENYHYCPYCWKPSDPYGVYNDDITEENIKDIDFYPDVEAKILELLKADEVFKENKKLEEKSNIPELNDFWKEQLGDNVQNLPEYEFRALRFAELHGMVDYDLKDNIMTFIEKLPYEGTYKHTVNLDTMEEKSELIGPGYMDNKLNDEEDIPTYKEVIKSYNTTDYGYHNNATTVYGELLDGNWYVFIPDNDTIDIYDSAITDKFIDTMYNYEDIDAEDDLRDDEWFDNFQKEHNITNKYDRDKLDNLEVELNNRYFDMPAKVEENKKDKVEYYVILTTMNKYNKGQQGYMGKDDVVSDYNNALKFNNRKEAQYAIKDFKSKYDYDIMKSNIESKRLEENKTEEDNWWELNIDKLIDYVDRETPEVIADLIYDGDIDMYNQNTGKQIALDLYNQLGKEETERLINEKIEESKEENINIQQFISNIATDLANKEVRSYGKWENGNNILDSVEVYNYYLNKLNSMKDIDFFINKYRNHKTEFATKLVNDLNKLKELLQNQNKEIKKEEKMEELPDLKMKPRTDGNKNYKKIDIFVDGKYFCSTNAYKTVKEAIESIKNEYPEFADKKVRGRFTESLASDGADAISQDARYKGEVTSIDGMIANKIAEIAEDMGDDYSEWLDKDTIKEIIELVKDSSIWDKFVSDIEVYIEEKIEDKVEWIRRDDPASKYYSPYASGEAFDFMNIREAKSNNKEEEAKLKKKTWGLYKNYADHDYLDKEDIIGNILTDLQEMMEEGKISKKEFLEVDNKIEDWFEVWNKGGY